MERQSFYRIRVVEINPEYQYEGLAYLDEEEARQLRDKLDSGNYSEVVIDKMNSYSVGYAETLSWINDQVEVN